MKGRKYMAKGGGMKGTKGMARGGGMKATKGMAKGGAAARAERSATGFSNMPASVMSALMGEGTRKAGQANVLKGTKGMAKGGTARQLIIQTLNRAKEDTVAKRVSLENALVASERKQTAMLSQRNFGYNTGVPFMPGQLIQMDPSSAFNMHLQQGVISGVASGVSGYSRANFVKGLGSGAPAEPRFVGPV